MEIRELAKRLTRLARQDRFRSHSALLLVGALLIAGCAAGGSQVADRAMKRGDWDGATQLLHAEALTDPDNAKVWARLGASGK